MFSQCLLEPIKLGSLNFLCSPRKEDSTPQKCTLYFGLMFMWPEVSTLVLNTGGELKYTSVCGTVNLEQIKWNNLM